MSDYFDSDNEELLKDFFMEAEQQIEKLEQNILAMEDDSTDGDAIDEIFRAAHTLKGGAATVHMMELAEFTHAVEDLLDGIRSNVCKINEEIVDKLLQALDVTKAMLVERQNGSIYQEDVTELKAQLRAFLGEAGKPAAKKSSASAPQPVVVQQAAAPVQADPLPALSQEDIREMQALIEGDQHVYRIRVEFDESNPMNSIGGIQVFAIMKRQGQVLRTVPDFDDLYEDEFHPYVDYYLLSSEDMGVLQQKSQVSEVTLSVAVVNVNDLPAIVGNGPALAEALVSTPVVKQEPVVHSAAVEEVPSDQNNGADHPAPAESKTVHKGAAHKKQEAQAQILRVDSRRIDSLLNLVSELVITKGGFNQAISNMSMVFSSFQNTRIQLTSVMKELTADVPKLVQQVTTKGVSAVSELRKELNTRFMRVFASMELFEGEVKGANSKVKGITGDLGRITGELHEGVLKIRMVPVDQVFQRFPRLVRDLSKALNKSVKLDIIGGETEMDKTVTEELVDPLMHCVRNSMDHGIETPEDRIAAGKPAEGHLVLRASNQGNMVVIEIIDDGKGIDVNAVRAKAIERGLISANKSLSDSEIFSLIMEPGFSTAAKITNISGRGVGLDVVKRSIEKLNGEINISSGLGTGSTFTIKLPLTLAIVQGLLVRVGQNVYAIPITSVLESFRVKKEELNILDGSEVFNVREDVVSIIRLSRIFGIEGEEDLACHYLVLVGSEEKKIGLLVDELIGEEDVVIKPLRDRYTGSRGIAGATILGDGTVSLIIDVGQLLLLGISQGIAENKQADEGFAAGEHASGLRRS